MTADQTAASTPETMSVYLWFAQPEVGPEHLLMVLTDDPEHGVTYRPLLALDSDTATKLRPTAEEAANALGVVAVLREYEATSLLDRIEPRP